MGAGGIGLRLTRHRKSALRLVGAAATIIFTSASFSLLLALAKFRDLAAKAPGAAFDFLVITKPTEWFDYGSLPPAILFLFGAGTFLVALLKSRGGAMGVVTPYWGHDEVDKRFRDSEYELQRTIENIKLSVLNAYNADFHKLPMQHEADAETLADIRDMAAANGSRGTHLQGFS